MNRCGWEVIIKGVSWNDITVEGNIRPIGPYFTQYNYIKREM